METEQIEKPSEEPEELDFDSCIENFKENHLNFIATSVVALENPSEESLKLASGAFESLSTSITPFLNTAFFSQERFINSDDDLIDKSVSVFLDKIQEIYDFKNSVSFPRMIVRAGEDFRAYAVQVFASQPQTQQEITDKGGLSDKDAMANRIVTLYLEPASSVMATLSTNPQMLKIFERKHRTAVLKAGAIEITRDAAKLAIGVSAGVALGIKFSGVLKK